MSRFAYCILAAVFGTLVLTKYSPHTGFTSLIRFGDTWANHRLDSLRDLPIATVAASNGYDGQFYAQVAIDPTLRSPGLDQALDLPTYRSRRILTSATAFVLGLGSPWWILQAYALLNVGCWFALAWLLYRLVGTDDWIGFARWAGCLLSMGVLESVRQSLVDLPALLLLVLAIRSRIQLSAAKSFLWLALANLAKEASLLGAFALTADGLVRKPWRRQALVGISAAIVPLGIWSLYVSHRFGLAAVDSTGIGNFSWPLVGLSAQTKACVRALLAGNFDSRYTFGLVSIVGLGIQSVVIWCNRDLHSPWWRTGAAYSLLLPMLSLWVWSGYWAACRAVLPMTIAFNLLLPAKRNFWPIWIAGNLTIVHAVWRFL